MKILYLECAMGAAGDMLAAALLELMPDPEGALEELRRLNIPGVTLSLEPSVKCGITGSHFHVDIGGVEEDENLHLHPGHHCHRGMAQVRQILSALPLPEAVLRDALAVYDLIARAESHAHNMPVEEIHFHEVGTMDAIADIVSVCWLMNRLAPDQVLASPVRVGSGTVRCAHGILPVPAPATACILRGVPICSGSIESELCTPTGAALLKHFVSSYGEMPVMTLENTGCGMGKKDFPQANCLRAMLGTAPERPEQVVQLQCSIDDMTGEALGFALEELMARGALDAWTQPMGMKKSRPGTLLSLLCRPSDREDMTALLFRLTSTLGVRECAMSRSTLTRRTETLDTPFGPVRRKISTGWGVTRQKYEYEDLARIAREQGLSPADVAARLP